MQELRIQLAAAEDIGTDARINECLMLSYDDLAKRSPALQPMFLT